MQSYQHFLVATDLAVDNDDLMLKAAELTKLYAAKLSAVNVVELYPAYAMSYTLQVDAEQEITTTAKTKLAALCKLANIAASDQYLEKGPANAKILELAKKIKADAIIIGSHGRHGLTALLGSTANSVAHNAECDVFMVRIGKESTK